MKILPVVLLSSVLLAVPAWGGDNTTRIEASRNAVKQLQGSLVTELQAAMKSGGPINAIEVCSKRASAIAADISRQHGWKVGRTSLKYRNPMNAPDAWEARVLQDFERRKAAGEDPAKLEFHEVVQVDGKPAFRYMKALPIPEGAPCLACHGQKLDPAVAAKIRKLYPQDKATGFKTGDLRGAVTITQPL